MGSRVDTDLVLDALLMTLWRRQPHSSVIVHSDQGCQFTEQEWQTFLRDHHLVNSVSRRGNCQPFGRSPPCETIRVESWLAPDDANQWRATPNTSRFSTAAVAGVAAVHQTG